MPFVNQRVLKVRSSISALRAALSTARFCSSSIFSNSCFLVRYML